MSNDTFFFFNRAKLGDLARTSGASSFQTAAPFPHVVLDDFLPIEVARRLAAEFPQHDAIDWRQRERHFERKWSTEDEENFPPFIRHVMQAFNSSVFTEFLEQISGIQGLVPDPHFRGGGLHLIRREGKLGVHADFNHYERLDLHRRLNVLFYLNEDWSEDFGGALELWNRDMSRCERRVFPILNRCVVFATTDNSYHGHPEPLACPEDRARRSLAFYYYTAKRPESELTRPHPTLFKARPGEEAPKGFARAQALRKLARDYVPKPLLDIAQRLGGRTNPGGTK